ncbi:hypothetical protein D3C80_735160 [compost metagenome]
MELLHRNPGADHAGGQARFVRHGVGDVATEHGGKQGQPRDPHVGHVLEYPGLGYGTLAAHHHRQRQQDAPRDDEGDHVGGAEQQVLLEGIELALEAAIDRL